MCDDFRAMILNVPLKRSRVYEDDKTGRGGGSEDPRCRSISIGITDESHYSVCRMVLDPKATSLHSDYGSFDRPLGAGEDHERDIEAAVDGSSSGMAQSSDVYQRQPLLSGVAPLSKSKDKWPAVSGSDYDDDEDEKDIESLGRHPGIPNGSGSGIVKLDIPAPLREEPRFPKEKWKTFLGKRETQ